MRRGKPARCLTTNVPSQCYWSHALEFTTQIYQLPTSSFISMCLSASRLLESELHIRLLSMHSLLTVLINNTMK